MRDQHRHTFVVRNAYTLFEVLASLGITGLLIAGIASTLLITSKAADNTAPTGRAIESARVIHQIASELTDAKLLLGYSNSEIAFIIDDIDDDGKDDYIRYTRTGSNGEALTRQLNNQPAVSISNHVAHFHLDVVTATRDRDTSMRTRTTHSPSISLASVPTTFTIDSTHFIAQALSADDLTTSLDAADSWAIHGVSIRAAQSGVADGNFDVEIRAADVRGTPTDLVLATQNVSEADLPVALDWVNITFDQPAYGLNPATSVCVVCKHASGTASAAIEFDDSGSGGVSTTNSAGATWTSDGLDRLTFQISTSDEQNSSLTINQRFATHFLISLAQQGSARITREGSFQNQPDLVTHFYEAQFNDDPSTLDLDHDGSTDWELDSGSIAGLADGVWIASASKKLQLTTPQNFATRTKIDLSCRSTQSVGDGAVLHVDSDWQTGTYGPLTLKVCLQQDNTQRLELATEESGTAKRLFLLNDLPNTMLAISLQIAPEQNHVHLEVNGADCGVFAYQPQPQPSGNPQFYLTNDVGSAEFDHISIRVMENSP